LVVDIPETPFIVTFPRFSRVPYYVPFLLVSVYLPRVSCSSRVAFRESNIGEFAKKNIFLSAVGIGSSEQWPRPEVSHLTDALWL
jgi:hypothetical protein